MLVGWACTPLMSPSLFISDSHSTTVCRTVGAVCHIIVWVICPLGKWCHCMLEMATAYSAVERAAGLMGTWVPQRLSWAYFYQRVIRQDGHQPQYPVAYISGWVSILCYSLVSQGGTDRQVWELSNCVVGQNWFGLAGEGTFCLYLFFITTSCELLKQTR